MTYWPFVYLGHKQLIQNFRHLLQIVVTSYDSSVCRYVTKWYLWQITKRKTSSQTIKTKWTTTYFDWMLSKAYSSSSNVTKIYFTIAWNGLLNKVLGKVFLYRSRLLVKVDIVVFFLWYSFHYILKIFLHLLRNISTWYGNFVIWSQIV